MLWFEVTDWKSHQTRKVEKFPWTRSQRREVERKARRAITAPTWRNKSHCRRNFNKVIFQVKEDLLESGAKCLSRQVLRMKGADEQAITFINEDTRKVHHPHDDAIVITFLIYTTRRVLVDNGSLADILYYPAFQQMRLGWDQLHSVNSP